MILRAILYLIAIAYLFSIEAFSDVLCIEIGGTRIKAAILPKTLTQDSFSEIEAMHFPTQSKSWSVHSEKFAQLFDLSSENPLSALLKKPYQEISLSVSGPVYDNHRYLDVWNRGIPYALRHACEEYTKRKVTIDNDAVCWAKGYLFYRQLQAQQVLFPCLALTLGTGIGAALIQSESTVLGIELAFIDCSFPRLEALAKGQPAAPDFGKWGQIHRTLGSSFFDWVGETESSRAEYNRRLIALIEDVREYLRDAMNIEFSSVCVGGGHSRFIQQSDLFPVPVDILSPQLLQQQGVSPDAIQLLGCLSNACKNQIADLHPPEDVIVKITGIDG